MTDSTSFRDAEKAVVEPNSKPGMCSFHDSRHIHHVHRQSCQSAFLLSPLLLKMMGVGFLRRDVWLKIMAAQLCVPGHLPNCLNAPSSLKTQKNCQVVKIFPHFPAQLVVYCSMLPCPDLNRHSEHLMVKIPRRYRCIKFTFAIPAHTLGSKGTDFGPQSPRGRKSSILLSSWITV